jgi:hypothetical protein
MLQNRVLSPGKPIGILLQIVLRHMAGTQQFQN